MISKEELERKYKKEYLKKGEKLIGLFQAQKTPSIWYYLLFGWLASFGTNLYHVLITNKGLHIMKINIKAEPKNHEFIKYSELKDLKLGKGILSTPIYLITKDDEKIKIKANKGYMGIDKETKDYLESLEINSK